MTTDLCAEDVVIQMSPQVEMTTEAGGEVRTGTGAGGAASASLELGRHLLVAARDGHTQLVLDLMAKGAPFTTDWLGTGPLHLAAGGDHAHTAGVLLRAGVSRDSRTKVERTPLHVAAHAGHAESAGVLLRHGALVDCRDLLRMTPLHWAADRGHASVVGLLIQHGADPAAVSKFNKTPGQLAMRRGHAAIVAMLEDAVRQREAARSVRALVEERLAEEQPTTDPLTLYKENVVEKIITTTTATEVPKHCHIKATKVKKAPEKPAKMEEKLQETVKEAIEQRGDSGTGNGNAAAILRRHGITLLPPDTGGTVLRALQGGRTVVLSDAGKLMLQESNAVRQAAKDTHPPAKVKLIQLPTEPRTAVTTVRRVTSAPSAPTPAKSRPPVKIIMNKSNFQRLVAGVQKPKQNNNTEPLTMTVVNENTMNNDEVATLKSQLAASQRTVARLTEELKNCRSRLAQYEGQ